MIGVTHIVGGGKTIDGVAEIELGTGVEVAEILDVDAETGNAVEVAEILDVDAETGNAVEVAEILDVDAETTGVTGNADGVETDTEEVETDCVGNVDAKTVSGVAVLVVVGGEAEVVDGLMIVPIVAKILYINCVRLFA
jgi:hypothetical protein